tara:strand:- start:105 stop:635 length:531 start_codon:yes stop_codon:yes gene_type:complete
MKNTLILVAVGLGIVYFLNKKKKNKSVSSKNATPKVVGGKTDNQLKNETTQTWISANERRGGGMNNEAVDDLTKKFFEGINDQESLAIYNKLGSEKADILLQKISMTDSPSSKKKLLRQLDQELGIGNTPKIMELMDNMGKFFIQQMTASMPSDVTITPNKQGSKDKVMSNFDYGL